jgi:HlyD family secretion protein
MKYPGSLLLPLALLGACHKAPPAPVYQAVPVEKRDISVSAQASGAINPDTVVDVKSKASGEILDIKVQTGDQVKRGTLILQVDQRIPKNDVDQAAATLMVDSAQLVNARSNLKREQDLFAARAVTQQELEAAQLTVSQANAAAVRDGISLENAKISLGDTQVLAPITGTVIAQTVQRGTVISSPTNSASGGTALLTMADLSHVQVKTWVDETDIGKIHEGMDADVSVAAYPNRPFRGTVAKIEPQADTIQNVTMFPVLVNIDNKDNLLKPGMNADVKLSVGQRNGVLAVPNAALRTDRDAASAASVLGISDASFQQMLAAAKQTMAAQTAQKADTASGASLPAPDSAAAGRRGGANPAGAGKSSGNGGGSRGGAGATGTTGSANAGAGGGGGAAGAAAGGAGRRGGGRGGRGGRADASAGGRYIVFTTHNGKVAPVYIQTGLTDLDYSEVKSGLVMGDSVLLLPSASLVNSQQQLQQRMSQNSGLPGQTKAATPSPGAASTTGAAPAGRGGGPR